jgi:hypothetical protein
LPSLEYPTTQTTINAANYGGTVQCPGDLDDDSVPDPWLDPPDNTVPNPDFDPNVRCMHLTAGDGFVTMADGRVQYTFGFSDVTGTPKSQVMDAGTLAAAFPAPTITVDEGNDFYLNLTNVGVEVRDDLLDPHSVHWLGFPQAAPIFAGVPDSSISINAGATLTYYYKVPGPGTYMYHCRMEATEHMQMGMSGNLYVKPEQDGTLFTFQGRDYTQFAYNDGDGSTGFPHPDRLLRSGIPRRQRDGRTPSFRRDEGYVFHAQRKGLPGHRQPGSASRSGHILDRRYPNEGIPADGCAD